NHSIKNADNQPSNEANVFSSSIGPFKSDLELCLYLVQHPNLINLAQSMLKVDGQESVMTLGKVDKFGALPEKDLETLQMNLKFLFFHTHVINKQIIDALMKSLFLGVQHIEASECAALQKWVFGCYRNYNASLRRELRNLVPEFIRKY
ncbi:15028_t:CDS:2, partial [Cetraspora pellucida]